MCTWWGGYVHLIVIAIGEKKRLLDHGAGVKGICKFLNMNN